MRTATDITEAIGMAKDGVDCMTQCPAHDDGKASLHVSPGTEQPVILNCHAGCETPDVLSAAGLTFADIAREQLSVSRGPLDPTHYTYHDAEGNYLFESIRYPDGKGGKTFKQGHRVGGKFVWGLAGVPRVLYRLPAVLRACERGEAIYIAEGEKDVEALRVDGFTATCNPMGAGKWLPEYSEYLRGATCVVIADNDAPGLAHARTVMESLIGVGCDVTVVKSEVAKDYFDHRTAGGTIESMRTLEHHDRPKPTRPAYTISQMVNGEFDSGREIIPGYFAETNVCLLVGPEGHGKSLLMRQIAVQCAAGINPFTSANMEPLRVLYLDAENPEHQQQEDWQMLDWLARRHRDGVEYDDRLRIVAMWGDQPNIVHPVGLDWFLGEIDSYRPHLCLMGPLADIVEGDPADRAVASAFKQVLRRARTICGTGFIVEHHSPHRMAGDKKREMRPLGSVVLRQFPDFGYGMEPNEDGTYTLHAWRGERVKRRAWPDQLRKGQGTMEWPWEFGEDVSGSVTVGNFGGPRRV